MPACQVQCSFRLSLQHKMSDVTRNLDHILNTYCVITRGRIHALRLGAQRKNGEMNMKTYNHRACPSVLFEGFNQKRSKKQWHLPSPLAIAENRSTCRAIRIGFCTIDIEANMTNQ